jgi:hypothetical protein
LISSPSGSGVGEADILEVQNTNLSAQSESGCHTAFRLPRSDDHLFRSTLSASLALPSGCSIYDYETLFEEDRTGISGCSHHSARLGTRPARTDEQFGLKHASLLPSPHPISTYSPCHDLESPSCRHESGYKRLVLGISDEQSAKEAQVCFSQAASLFFD